MRRSLWFVMFVVLYGMLGSITLAQGGSASPTRQFRAYAGGPDVVDLLNLNVHWDIPVIHRSGRGTDFDYSLSYDSSVWSKVSSSGTTSWQPIALWGWSGATQGATGSVGYSSYTDGCYGDNGQFWSWTEYSGYYFIDSSGVTHNFPNAVIVGVGTDKFGCLNQQNTDTADDGSGYSITVSKTSNKVSWKNGLLDTPPVNVTTGAASYYDRNGNLISVDASGHIFDTLNGTTPVLTIAGTGTPSSSKTYTYKAPSGANAAYTMKFASYSVQTNFGCSGVSEYGPVSNNLVSEVDLPDGSKYTFQYEPTPSVSGKITGRLQSITLPTGGTINYSYSGGCSTSATLTRTTPDGTWTYAKSQVAGLEFQTKTTSPAGDDTVVYYYSLDPQGAETQRKVYQGAAASGTLLQTITTCYNGNTTNCPSATVAFPIFSRTVTTQFGASGLQSKQAYTYDTYGQVTEEDDYDYASGAPTVILRKQLVSYASLGNGIVSQPSSVTIQDGSGNVRAKTTYTYDGTAVTASTGTPNLIAVTGARGNPTKISQWVVGTTTLDTNVSYYDTGMPNSSTDVNGAVTTYLYSNATLTCGNAFPTSVNEPLSLSRSFTWNCSGAVMSSFTEENGLISSTTFSDPYFWRPASSSSPDGGLTSWAYNSPTSTTTTMAIGATLGKVSSTILDGLGRPIQQQLTSDPEGTTYLDTSYDSLGRTASVSNPYRTTSDPTYGVTATQYDALGRITKVIPPDGSASSNNVVTSYTNNCATNTDQAGKSNKTCLDGLGRIVQVFEDPSGFNYETDYAYDPLGDILSVNQKGGSSNSANWRTRTSAYDGLSNLLCEAAPEIAIATCPYPDTGTYTAGTIRYTYNSSGDLGTRKAPAPNQTGSSTVTTTYSYDALHRLTQKSYSDGTTATVKYGYDGIAPSGCTPPTLSIHNGKLRRTSMCDGAGSQAWSYDITSGTGWKVTTARTTNSVTKNMATQSALDGSTVAITYPSTEVVTLTPSGAGRIVSVVGAASYASNALYSPSGSVCFFNSSWGQSWTHRYSYNSRLQPVAIQVYGTGYGLTPSGCGASADTVGGGPVLTYSFVDANGKNNGNLIQETNNQFTNRTKNYTYDALNRVSSAQSSGTHTTSPSDCWAESYTYDPWGNLYQIALNSSTQSAYVGCSQESGLSTSATTQNHLAALSYDAAGGVITNPGVASYSYDAEGRLISTAGITYSYDGDGNRVMKSGGPIYWYGTDAALLAETNSSGTVQYQYYYLNGMRVSRKDFSNSWINHYGLDLVGNTRSFYGYNGAWDTSDYYPFGGERAYNSAGGNKYKFTSLERDSESGLDHAQNRQLSSALGRWLPPDPASANAAKQAIPQTRNRYSYVLNSPSTKIDPSGLDSVNCVTSGTPAGQIDPGQGLYGTTTCSFMANFYSAAYAESPVSGWQLVAKVMGVATNGLPPFAYAYAGGEAPGQVGKMGSPFAQGGCLPGSGLAPTCSIDYKIGDLLDANFRYDILQAINDALKTSSSAVGGGAGGAGQPGGVAGDLAKFLLSKSPSATIPPPCQPIYSKVTSPWSIMIKNWTISHPGQAPPLWMLIPPNVPGNCS